MSDHKKTATDFLQLAASGQVREAFERFAGPGFRHHNPNFAGDAAALMAGMEQNSTANPDKVFEVKMAIAEGERVAVHSHVRLKPGARGVSVVHLFRFEDGRIAELWDIGQLVPEHCSNDNGMF
jgi:predicted SnoaL-like aldol condensation-catalyzing enzyme